MTTISIDLRRQLAPDLTSTLPANVAVETAWAFLQFGPSGAAHVRTKAPSRYTLTGGVGTIQADPTTDGNALRIRFASGLPEPIEVYVLVPASGTHALTTLVQVDPATLQPAAAYPTIGQTLAAYDATIDDKVADAVEAHTPGIELAYAERTTSATSTATASGSLVSGLSATIIGKGRPVDVELFTAGQYHSVANTPTVAYVAVNGTATGGLTCIGVSQRTDYGDSKLCKRRIVLTNGVSYTFTVGLWATAAGTTTLQSSAFTPSFLSVVSR